MKVEREKFKILINYLLLRYLVENEQVLNTIKSWKDNKGHLATKPEIEKT